MLPFRSNPKITTNWSDSEDNKHLVNETKNSYYDISASVKPGSLVINFREEKTEGLESHFFGFLAFDLKSNFARDLKMFLNEYVSEDAPEVKKEVENGSKDNKVD
jgi:hypothetical protein